MTAVPEWIQIHPRLPRELVGRMRGYASGKGASQSAVIQTALEKYLADANDATMVIRRLDRVSRAVGGLRRDVGVVADALGVFVQVWLAHTPRIADADRPGAEKAAHARFAQFTEHVASRFASGRSFMSELVRDADLDDPEALGGNGERR
jgi:hypothetical protein